MSPSKHYGANPPDLTLTQAPSTTSDTHKADVHMADESDYEPSEASSYDPATALLDTISQPSKKRRQSLDATDARQPKKVRLEADPPRSREHQKLVKDRAKQLPTEIWQHIFTLVPPRDLGRLLTVNKLFHAFLSPFVTSSPARHNAVPSCLPPLKPDAIWQASRRLVWPRMPAPLKGRSEVQMWRLVCSVSCQFCGSKGQKRSLPSNNEAWRSGPGPSDVCPIFPFCVVTCGNCLKKKAVKEIDLLLSSSFPSVLLPALPPVLVDADMHVIHPRAIQTGAWPPNTQVTKLYWSEHIEQINAEFEKVKALGSAAAEEWIKGLEIRGKQTLVDASRWEKWAGSGGMAQMRVPMIATNAEVPVTSMPLHPLLPLSKPCLGPDQQTDEQQKQAPVTNEQPGPAPQLNANSQQSRTPAHQKRTKEEAARFKAQRRADIESRAMLLDPPLTADVLVHIPSFQAALQIINPLDDNAWELLKIRLLAQREEAELREKQSSVNAQTLREKIVVKEVEKKPTREPKEVTDQEWDDIQGPVRARISEYADEIIEGWNYGAKVKKKNCPHYAADVLLYVRKRFYAEVAKDTAAIIDAGKKPVVEPPEGPWAQKLTLENMKWVFDVKIKPRTEPLRKELFLCNGCLGGNGVIKFFGFEGVLQHYAAKHTLALSLGNIVVHWRAEWPEVPPFSPDPLAKEKAYYDKDSNSLRSASAAIQQPYPGFQSGLPTGYVPPVYGTEVPPLSHYSSGPPVPMPPMATCGQATPHPYGAPYSTTPYYDPASYASYSLPFSLGMTYGSHDQSNGYTAPPVSAHGHFDYEPYSSHHDTTDTTPADHHQQSRSETLIRNTQSVWSKIGFNRKAPPAIRAYALIYHVTKAFEETYHEVPSLAMFIEATAKARKLRTFRSLNGVSCRVCNDNTVFHLPKLAIHFESEHVKLPRSQGRIPVDWRTHMIKLPEEERLAGFAERIPRDSTTYSLLQEAIPWAFEQSFIEKHASKHVQAMPNGTPRPQELTQPPDQAFPAVASDQSKKGRLNSGVEHLKKQGQQPDHACPVNQPQTTIFPNEVSSPAHLHNELDQDVPHLRPASEVYGRKNRWPPVSQARPAAQADANAARLGDHSPADSEISQEPSRIGDRGEVRIKSEHESAAYPLSRPLKPRNGGHWRDEISSDYRDIRERRYSGIEPAGLRDRSASVGNRPQEHPSPMTASTNIAPSYVEAGRRGEEPQIVQNHQIGKEEVIYVDESGREIGRGLRARNTLPRESRYGAPDDRRFGDYGRQSSSWYSGHGRVHYQERSPWPRYAPPEYQYEPPTSPLHAYYDRQDTRPPPERPSEAYEIVEVRHPNGDYFIRRPIRRDDRPYYAYETRQPPREHSVCPQRIVEDPLGYGLDPRANPSVPGQPAPRPGYDDYDPRYPSSTTGEPSAYPGNQR